jgi:hypothetical protein
MLGLLLAVPLLVFHGNVALVEDVYRSVLELPANSRASPATARMVVERLRRFLREAGYTLATVNAHVADDQIVVELDEGRLDKVIVVGGGAFETLRLRLDLHLQNNVFNQPELQRQLKVLAARVGLSDFAYEVVPVQHVEPPRVQLEEFETLEELSLGMVRPGRPYELHILVQPGVFRPGISPELEVDSLEGGGVGATYRSGRLLSPDDRWQLEGRIAGALRQPLDASGAYFTFTRAVGSAEYDAPPIAGVLRPSLNARFDVSDRQRPDLNLESYRFAAMEAAAKLLLVPDPHLRASAGAGAERRLLFYVAPKAGGVPVPGPQYSAAQTRLFAETELTLVFDPEALRRDRHHQIDLTARLYARPGDADQGALSLIGSWRKMWPQGWNEIWAEAYGFARSGYILFPEEQSIGDTELLRGPFGTQYARHVLGVDVEYRYSLMRDVFKLGLFNHAALYGEIDRVTNGEIAALADVVGLGVHALMIDEFQLDAWFGFGWTQRGLFDKGAALAIRQAF